jgi:RNA polymerase sigma factor (sigma-70 family)
VGENHDGGRQTRFAGTRPAKKEALRQKEPELQRLVSEGKKDEFFRQIVPLLLSLKSYIKRRLRIAYLSEEIRTPVVTSGDILDDVVLEAYQEYATRPPDLTLEQWLYQIANRTLDRYHGRQQKTQRRRRILETLEQSELGTLEEIRFTADAEGEPWLPEDLDDSEIQPRDLKVPADRDTPEAQLERKEGLRQLFNALFRIPERDRTVFDLAVIEGFSCGAVAKMSGIPETEVREIVERVKRQLRDRLERQTGLSTPDLNLRRQAS